MEKKSLEKSGNIVINAKAVKISNNQTKKKNVPKNISFKPKALNNRELQFALIENFVNMQKVLTNLTVKFDMLSNNMSQLLSLFELSARNFIHKPQGDSGNLSGDEEKKLLNKLDVLLDQNKTVAKGITLIEEKIRHKIYGENPQARHNPTGPSINLSEKPRPGLIPRI